MFVILSSLSMKRSDTKTTFPYLEAFLDARIGPAGPGLRDVSAATSGRRVRC
jgi:hypothetical protein